MTVNKRTKLFVENEDLALCKIKLKSAESLINRMEGFNKLLKSKYNELGNSSRNDVGTPLSPMQLDELTRERNSLRDDLVYWENNYSGLFKNYEKQREDIVLLKNSEEELKGQLVEEAAKYERLSGKYKELRIQQMGN
ncbi:TACC_C domain-containing protein [Meloidogyne graminicola]|uniref:TACC_C domain-containing protein n=1 Tax=Meloidogyne graminicola TaxID=189291 RepID=A0A8T0A0M1_9BILA|nr:TACC_C domain-containing protein [Meloidogyne graminicola]